MADRIEWVADGGRFAELASPWDKLAAVEPHPFLDHDWLRCWWTAFRRPGDRLAVCAAWRGDALVAGLALAERRGRLSSLANYHTGVFAPLACDEAALRSVLDAALLRRAAEVHIQALPHEGPAVRALPDAADEAGRALLLESAHTSPIVRTGGDRDPFDKRLGVTWRKRRRKLERDHVTVFRSDDGTRDLESQLRVGFAVEGSGWKTRAATAIAASPQTTRFYSDVAALYRNRGELRLYWLEVDGRPVAFNFCLQRSGRLFLLKTGYVEEARGLAPGIVLNILTTEHCFESGLDAYELLGESEEWKQRLADDARRHVRIWAFRRGPAGFVRHLARRHGVPLARRLRDLRAREH